MLPGAAPPLLDAARRSTWEPRGSFLLAGAALQALDGTRSPPSSFYQHLGFSAGRGSTSGSGRYPSAFRGPPRCCQAQHLGASRLVSAGRGRLWTVPERVSGPAALGSLAPRFCWQGQHFRLWTVRERVSGPPS